MIKIKVTRLKIIVAFLKKNILLILLGLFIGFLAYQLTPNLIKKWQQHQQKNRVIVMVGNYTLFSLPSEVENLISLGLTSLTPEGEATAGAALKWEVKNQGKTYLFTLNTQLKWHDGKFLEAQDIDYQITGVEKTIVSPNQIQFDLEEPFAPFPVSLAKPLFRKKTLGLGEYKIKSIETRLGDIISQIKLVSTSKNYNQELTFNFYPTEEMLKNAFLLGEVKEAWGLNNVEEFKKWPNIKITPQQKSNERYIALFFNTKKSPFDDKRFRQALAYMKEKPLKETRALSPISPFSWAYNKNVKTYDFNPIHANKILEEAGINSSGTEITLVTPADLLTLADKIKKNWEGSGIKVKVLVESLDIQKEDFDVILGYGIIPPDPDQYYFWHSGQPGNITNYENPRIDKLLEEGRKIMVKEKRKEIYYDFQRFLVEDSPAIFLAYPEIYNIFREPIIKF